MSEPSQPPYFLAGPRTEVEFLDAPEAATVVHKVTDHPLTDMATVFDRAFSALFPLLAARGVQPVGPGFSLHRRMPTDTATFEVGAPVDRPLDGIVTTDSGVALEPSTLPGGPVGIVSHLGAYERLGDAWGAFMGAVAAADKRPDLPFWEIYVTEPSPGADPESLRTDLVTKVIS